ncbi:MAG: EAL domain-containing protein [Proteobacteria bacterium]|nr:EAL domain-containing protein [Pseudomonadota bacterium]
MKPLSLSPFALALVWQTLHARLSLRLALLAVAVFLTGTLADAPGSASPSMAVWCLDAGLLALALRARRRHVPAYLLVSFLAAVAGRLAAGDGVWFALGFAVASAACVVVPTLILRSSQPAPVLLVPGGNQRPALHIAAAVIAGVVIAAAFGSAVASTRPGSVYTERWLEWFAGDVLGMVGLLPLGLTLTRARLERLRQPGCSVDLLVALLLTGASTLLGLRFAPFPFVVIGLPLLLVALRLPLLGTTLVVACETLLYAGLAAGGVAPGPYVDALSSNAHIFNAATLLAPLLVAGLREARAADAMRLQQLAARGASVLDGVGQGTWEWHPASGEAHFSPGWHALTGIVPGAGTAGIEHWIHHVHPEDVGRVLGGLEAHIDGEGSEFDCAHRIGDGEGGWRWVRARGRIVERTADAAPLALFGLLTDIDAEVQAEAERIALAQRLSTALDAGGIALWEWDLERGCLLWSEHLYELLDWRPAFEQARAAQWLAIVHPPDRRRVRLAWARAASAGEKFTIEFRVCPPGSGTTRTLRCTGEPGGDDRHTLRGAAIDVTEARQLASALADEKARLQVTLYGIGDAVIATDLQARVNFLNPAAERMLDLPGHEAIGLPLATLLRLVDERSGEPIADPVVACLRSGERTELPDGSTLLGHDGRRFDLAGSAAPLRAGDGSLRGAVLVCQDVTARRAFQRELHHQAAHDHLTGLLNRRAFERALDELVTALHRGPAREHALCFVDLDRFKAVNDTAGHAAGDALLGRVAALLRAGVRGTDVIARLGGDEFALILVDCPQAQAVRVADKLVAAVRSLRFVWEGQVHEIGASIGLVPVTAGSGNVATLTSQADVACYAAKGLGRNRVAVYSPDNEAIAREHREISAADGIRQALEAGRFSLYAQPIVAVGTPESEQYFELLLRMVDGEGRLVPPGAFLPAAERYELMPALDRWAIGHVLHTLGPTIAALPALMVSLNLSAGSINDPSFRPWLEAALAQTPVPVARIGFEFAESVAVSNLIAAGDLIQWLRARGCRVALDDFGTGLSSFSYLKHFPVDFVKIDGSFIAALGHGAVDRAIVESLNDIAHRLGVRTIAEGVESSETLGLLQQLGIDYAQGMALGAPVALGEQLAALRELDGGGRPKLKLVR